MSQEQAFKSGRILRANGRYSITHLWEVGVDELKTKCGLLYEASELYDGDDEVDIFDGSASPDWLNCGDCFPDGTATTVRVG